MAEQYNAYKDQQAKMFDLKRNALKTELDKQAKLAEKQTKTRLAGAGVTDTSGLAQKQLQRADLAVKSDLYKGLGNIGMEQLKTESEQGYAEAQEAKKARQAALLKQGQLGSMSQTDLDKLKSEDQMSYDIYKTGAFQTELENVARNKDNIQKQYEAYLTSLDSESPAFKDQMANALWEVSGGTQGKPVDKNVMVASLKDAMDAAKTNHTAAARKENIWGQTYHDWNSDAAKAAEQVYLAAKLKYENAVAGR
jgi:hypothetical protein